MEVAFLCLGSNEGERLQNLKCAVNFLAQTEGLQLQKISSVYETEPVGVTNQNDFLNAVLKIGTVLEPLQLLERLQLIEKALGRRRTVKWAPRVIDIDILYYGERIVDHPRLKIPHPHIDHRRFVLVPLCEVAPETTAPDSGIPLRQLLEKCPDKSRVELYCPWLQGY